MPRMVDSRTVAINTQQDNVIAGKQHEFLQSPSLVRFSIVAARQSVRTTILIGSNVLIQDQELSGANRFPNYPDDVIVEGAGFRGDRILVQIRNVNAAGGPDLVHTVVDVFPR